MEDEVRMPASAHSVGATVGTVSSAPVGWVGSGEVLHTPNLKDLSKTQGTITFLIIQEKKKKSKCNFDHYILGYFSIWFLN